MRSSTKRKLNGGAGPRKKRSHVEETQTETAHQTEEMAETVNVDESLRDCDKEKKEGENLNKRVHPTSSQRMRKNKFKPPMCTQENNELKDNNEQEQTTMIASDDVCMAENTKIEAINNINPNSFHTNSLNFSQNDSFTKKPVVDNGINEEIENISEEKECPSLPCSVLQANYKSEIANEKINNLQLNTESNQEQNEISDYLISNDKNKLIDFKGALNEQDTGKLLNNETNNTIKLSGDITNEIKEVANTETASKMIGEESYFQDSKTTEHLSITDINNEISKYSQKPEIENKDKSSQNIENSVLSVTDKLITNDKDLNNKTKNENHMSQSEFQQLENSSLNAVTEQKQTINFDSVGLNVSENINVEETKVVKDKEKYESPEVVPQVNSQNIDEYKIVSQKQPVCQTTNINLNETSQKQDQSNLTHLLTDQGMQHFTQYSKTIHAIGEPEKYTKHDIESEELTPIFVQPTLLQDETQAPDVETQRLSQTLPELTDPLYLSPDGKQKKEHLFTTQIISPEKSTQGHSQYSSSFLKSTQYLSYTQIFGKTQKFTSNNQVETSINHFDEKLEHSQVDIKSTQFGEKNQKIVNNLNKLFEDSQVNETHFKEVYKESKNLVGTNIDLNIPVCKVLGNTVSSSDKYEEMPSKSSKTKQPNQTLSFFDRSVNKDCPAELQVGNKHNNLASCYSKLSSEIGQSQGFDMTTVQLTNESDMHGTEDLPEKSLPGTSSNDELFKSQLIDKDKTSVNESSTRDEKISDSSDNDKNKDIEYNSNEEQKDDKNKVIQDPKALDIDCSSAKTELQHNSLHILNLQKSESENAKKGDDLSKNLISESSKDQPTKTKVKKQTAILSTPPESILSNKSLFMDCDNDFKSLSKSPIIKVLDNFNKMSDKDSTNNKLHHNTSILHDNQHKLPENSAVNAVKYDQGEVSDITESKTGTLNKVSQNNQIESTVGESSKSSPLKLSAQSKNIVNDTSNPVRKVTSVESKVFGNDPIASTSLSHPTDKMSDFTDSQLEVALDDCDFEYEIEAAQSKAISNIKEKKTEGENCIRFIVQQLGRMNHQLLRMKREMETVKRKTIGLKFHNTK